MCPTCDARLASTIVTIRNDRPEPMRCWGNRRSNLHRSGPIPGDGHLSGNDPEKHDLEAFSRRIAGLGAAILRISANLDAHTVPPEVVDGAPRACRCPLRRDRECRRSWEGSGLCCYVLSLNAGRVSTFDRLLRQVWGWRHAGDVGGLRTVMKKLRRKPVDDAARPNWIFSGRGVGYRMARLGVSPPPFR